VLLLLSDESFEGRYDNVIISKRQRFALIRSMKPHPGKRIWRQMSKLVSRASLFVVLGLAVVTAYSRLPVLFRISNCERCDIYWLTRIRNDNKGGL